MGVEARSLAADREERGHEDRDVRDRERPAEILLLTELGLQIGVARKDERVRLAAFLFPDRLEICVRDRRLRAVP